MHIVLALVVNKALPLLRLLFCIFRRGIFRRRHGNHDNSTSPRTGLPRRAPFGPVKILRHARISIVGPFDHLTESLTSYFLAVILGQSWGRDVRQCKA